LTFVVDALCARLEAAGYSARVSPPTGRCAKVPRMAVHGTMHDVQTERPENRLDAVVATLGELFTDEELAVIDALVARPPSCVGSTGVLADPALECADHVDGAHRCVRAPQHPLDAGLDGPPGVDHVCTCGFVWVSVRDGMAGLRREWESVHDQAWAEALREVLAEVRRSQAPHASVLSALVVGVAQENKVDLEGEG
jgi:hypothetical protein